MPGEEDTPIYSDPNAPQPPPGSVQQNVPDQGQAANADQQLGAAGGGAQLQGSQPSPPADNSLGGDNSGMSSVNLQGSSAGGAYNQAPDTKFSDGTAPTNNQGGGGGNVTPAPQPPGSRARAIATMAAALRMAGKDLGLTMPDTLVQLMLGQMLGPEGAMPGLPGSLGNTNNVGASQVTKGFAALAKGRKAWGAMAHLDSMPTAHGQVSYLGWYFIIDSPYSAARYWLGEEPGGVKYAGVHNVLVAQPTDAATYAALMYKGGYYQGTTTDPQKAIAAYAAAISRGMPSLATMNGAHDDPKAVNINPSAFPDLKSRSITESLYDTAKSGGVGSAWSFLLPASWADMQKTNGIVWFGPPPGGKALGGIVAAIGVIAGLATLAWYFLKGRA